MADGSAIEWTEATWNPITGCSVTSPGCTNCYAMRLAGTRLRNHPSRAGLTVPSKAGPVWTGEVRFNEQWLDQPLRWTRPRRIFVCAHGDLFHPDVPEKWIDRVFDVMARAYQHTFQVLTKRPERMRAYIQTLGDYVSDGRFSLAAAHRLVLNAGDGDCYLPNVWLGVSVEDQPRAAERIPHLLATPARVRYVSAEPLLAMVNIAHLDLGREVIMNGFDGTHMRHTRDGFRGRSEAVAAVVPGIMEHSTGRLHWVIGGGESGPGARNAEPSWFYYLRDQCRTFGVPYFHKQMAHKAPIPPDLNIREWPIAA